MLTRFAVFAALVALPALAGAQSVPTGDAPASAAVVVASETPSASSALGVRAFADAFVGSPLERSGRGSIRSAASPNAQLQPDSQPTADRKGFLIGVGVGPGLHRTPGFTVVNQAGRVISESPGTRNFGLATDFKVGYAPSDRFLAYYSNKVGFTSADRYDAVGVTGFGITYMARATSPTPFVSGSVGPGFGRSLVGTSRGANGVGVSIGAGYEFARRWSVDGDVILVRLGPNDNHAVFKGSFNFLFY